jgi:hypothetical protein
MYGPLFLLGMIILVTLMMGIALKLVNKSLEKK